MMIIKIWHKTLTKLWYRLWNLLVLGVEKHGKVRETEIKKNKENDLAKRKVAATQAKLKQNSSKTQTKSKQNSSKVRLRGKDEALPPNFVCACAAIRAGPHRRRAVRSAGLHHVPAQLPVVTRTACHDTNVHFHVNQSPVRLSMQAPLDHLSN